MRTWFALVLAALVVTSFHFDLNAQVVIRKKAEEAGPQAPKKMKKKAESRIVIRGEDGEEHVLELQDDKSKKRVIDLGDGKKAIIVIESQTAPEVLHGEEIIIHEHPGHAGGHPIILKKLEEAHQHAHHDGDESPSFSFEIELDGDGCEVECEAEGMSPLIGSILQGLGHEDMAALAPLAGQFLSQIDMQSLAPMMGKLMEDLEVEIDDEDIRIQGHALNLKELLKGHHHELKDVHEHLAGLHMMAPSVKVEAADAACECECDCACKCCKAGSCPNTAKKKANVFFGHAPKPAERRDVILRKREIQKDSKPKVFAGVPKVERRVLVAPHGGGHAAIEVKPAEPGPKAPKTKRGRVFRMSPTEIPQDGPHGHPHHGGKKGVDLDDIEHRLQRLADEMQALQKELRAIKKKI